MFKNRNKIKKLENQNLELQEQINIYRFTLNLIIKLSSKDTKNKQEDILHQIFKIAVAANEENKKTNSTHQSKVSL